MKKSLLNIVKGGFVATFFVVSLFSFAQEKQASASEEAPAEIQWMTWEEMMEAQKTERKKVFIDVYTDWCGWCKKMDASTFKDPTIVNFMNSGFYAVKLDAEMKEAIEFNGFTFVNPNPNGKRSTHQLAASMLDGRLSYPSFVILDENLARQHIIKGFQQPETLLGILLFFKTNEFVRYRQYLEEQEKIRQQQAARQQQQQQQQQPQTDTP